MRHAFTLAANLKELTMRKIAHLKVLNDHSLKVHKLNADMTLNESPMNSPASGNGQTKFDFDRVFGPNATQQQVFKEISEIIQFTLDGFNVCIFAYGPTNLGKTHTRDGIWLSLAASAMITLPRFERDFFMCFVSANLSPVTPDSSRCSELASSIM